MFNHRILIGFLGLLMISTIASAQSILISKPIEVSNRTPKFKLLGKNQAGFWVRNYGRDEERIDLYDENLNLTSAKTLLIRRNNYTPITFSVNKMGATFFYSDYQKKNYYLFFSQISDRLETSIEQPLDTVIFENNTDEMKASFSYSLNKQFIDFFIPVYTNGKLTQMHIVSTTNTGKIRFKKNIPIARNNAETFAEDGLIDNMGNTYLVLKHETKEYNPVYEVKKIGANGQISDSCFVSFEKEVFNDMYFQIDEKNKRFICQTLLSGLSAGKVGAKSILNYSINTDSMTQQFSQEYVFDDAFIEHVTNGIVKENGALYTYKIKKIYSTLEGGTICMAESFYKEDNEIHDPIDLSMPTFGGVNYLPSTRMVNVFHYNDVLLFYFNSDGSFNKYEIIRKKQATENDNGSYSSFSAISTGLDLKMFFVDDLLIKNDFVEESIDADMNISKKILLNQNDKNLMLIPKMAVQTQVNELVLPSYRNNDFRLIKINY